MSARPGQGALRATGVLLAYCALACCAFACCVLAGCLEAPFAPPPTRGGVCIASAAGGAFRCNESCAARAVEASAGCASTLEGTFDPGHQVCRFADGSSADFGAPLGSLAEIALGEHAFKLTLRRGSTLCLQLHVDPAPEHDAEPPRTTDLVLGDRACYQQRVTYAPRRFDTGFVPVAVEVLCEQHLLRSLEPELCNDCPSADCAELPLLRVELSEDARGVVELRLVAGESVTPLLSCRRAP